MLLSTIPFAARAADVDEFRVKRASEFRFASAPRIVSDDGTRVTVEFETTADCDVTVAVEDADGRIVRHLASGVLGSNAPAPFAKNSRRQTLVWDGKNDQGEYVDDRRGATVRVSLGLRPRFERTLFWSPYKRIGEAVQLVAAAPEGVYVYDGLGLDHLRLYDHEGRYLRTVHPFAGDKVDAVKGLNRRVFPQSGVELPVKNSLYQQTLLSSGDNASLDDRGGMTGTAATAMAVLGDRIALVKRRLNRLKTDGTTGDLSLTGSETALKFDNFKVQYKRDTVHIDPSSAAFSPDGKWLYLTGYAYRFTMNFHCLSGVFRLPYETDGPLELFAGGDAYGKHGEGDKELQVATSVGCDAAGRVFVADHAADRIQVFSPEGRLLRSMPVEKPAQLRFHRRTGELYVFSWLVCHEQIYKRGDKQREQPTVIKAAMRRFGPYDDPGLRSEHALPLPEFKGQYSTYTGIDHALLYHAEVDSWTDPPTIWLSRDCVQNIERGVHPGDGGRRTAWEQAGMWLLRPAADGSLEIVRDFGKLVTNDPGVVRARPPSNAIQHLIVDPVSGKPYLGEADSGATVKAFKQLVVLDPGTGRAELLDTPFNALEGAFDPQGRIHLRTTDVVVRYELPGWREIPFDYGEQLPQVGAGMFGRFSKSVSGLVMPAASPVCFHQGGFSISPKGHIVASCAYRYTGPTREGEQKIRLDVGGGGDVLYGQAYAPRIFPGRSVSSTGACVHVWDKHGQLLYEDAIPGCPQLDGIGMDRDDNLYVMATPTRVLDGKKYFDEMSETLIRFVPKKNKIVSASPVNPVPLAPDARPPRAPELHKGGFGDAWADGAQWFYGGVGFAGFNTSRAGGGCACWFSRFVLDWYGRSIAPEPLHYSVAVLDSAGNLVTRIGRYGNVDDGRPLVTDGGPAEPRAIGGDETALFHACYVGTHTDRRLFVSDVGNGRIVSVKLDYHENASLPLKNVPKTK